MRRSTVLEISLSSGHIIWKETLYFQTSFFRQVKTNWKISWGIHQSLGWWYHSHNCSNTLWSPIPYHALKWLYECSTRARNTCPQTRNVIYNASPSWTYYLFKKENFKSYDIPDQIFFKAGSAEIKKISNTPNFFTYNATWIM